MEKCEIMGVFTVKYWWWVLVVGEDIGVRRNRKWDIDDIRKRKSGKVWGFKRDSMVVVGSKWGRYIMEWKR